MYLFCFGGQQKFYFLNGVLTLTCKHTSFLFPFMFSNSAQQFMFSNSAQQITCNPFKSSAISLLSVGLVHFRVKDIWAVFFHFYSKFDRTLSKQTVEILIGHCIMRCLIWTCADPERRGAGGPDPPPEKSQKYKVS